LFDFYNNVSKETPTVYIKYKLCEKFGWTEQELSSQSYSFISEIIEVMNMEAVFNKKDYGHDKTPSNIRSQR